MFSVHHRRFHFIRLSQTVLFHVFALLITGIRAQHIHEFLFEFLAPIPQQQGEGGRETIGHYFCQSIRDFVNSFRVTVIQKEENAPWNPKDHKTQGNSNHNFRPGRFLADRGEISIVQILDLPLVDVYGVKMTDGSFHDFPLQDEHKESWRKDLDGYENVNVDGCVGLAQLTVQRYGGVVVELREQKGDKNRNAPTKCDNNESATISEELLVPLIP